MLSPSSSSPQFDAYQALRRLQMSPHNAVGELQSAEYEIAFIKAIRREPTTQIGSYQLHMDTSRDDRTTIFVQNPSGEEPHKYVIVHANDHRYVVAAPFGWTKFHKNIVSRIMVATPLSVFCSGGGFVSVLSKGTLIVDGESTDFGAGDHALAKAALSRAVKGPAEE